MATVGRLASVDGYKYKLISLSAGHAVVNILDVTGPVLLVFMATSLNLGNATLAAGKEFNASLRDGMLLVQVLRVVKEDASIAIPGR